MKNAPKKKSLEEADEEDYISLGKKKAKEDEEKLNKQKMKLLSLVLLKENHKNSVHDNIK